MTLDPHQRRVFAQLADILVPGSDTVPSATAAGVGATLIDQVVGYRPDLAGDFHAALAQCAGRVPADVALDDLSATEPEQFAALAVLTAAAYVLSPQVWEALGLQPAPRVVTDDTDDYLDMLAAVVERGFPNPYR